MKTLKRCILIDDDPINTMLCSKIIKSALSKLDIKIFDDAQEGLGYIEKEYAKEDAIPTVLFLDINMPTWSGWEFLENFGRLCNKVKEQIKVYMLSSSIDDRDINKAKSNPLVGGYISKPLTVELVSEIIRSVA